MNPKLRTQAQLKALRASDVAAAETSGRFPRCIHHSRSRKSFLCRNTFAEIHYTTCLCAFQRQKQSIAPSASALHVDHAGTS